MSKPLKDEDDFSHYFNACARLSAQNQYLRKVMNEAIGDLSRVDEIAEDRVANAMMRLARALNVCQE